MHPQSSPLTLAETDLEESGESETLMFWWTFDAKMTFKKHIRYVSRAAFIPHSVSLLYLVCSEVGQSHTRQRV